VDPAALALLLDDTVDAQVIVLGRKGAVERIADRLQRGLPIEVTSSRPSVPATGRPRDDRCFAKHLDVRTADVRTAA
jgi:hypothetical protein